MHRRWIEAALLVGLAATTAGGRRRSSASDAGRQPSIMNDEPTRRRPPPRRRRNRCVRAPASRTPAFEHDPDLDAQDQFAPSQVQQPMPDAVAMPSGGKGGGHARAAARGSDAATEPGAVARASRSAKPNIVACSGVFGQGFKPRQARLGLPVAQRRLHPGRRQLRRQGDGKRALRQRSEAAPGGVVVETGEPQRHPSHRHQRPIGLDRARRASPRADAGGTGKAQRQAVQALRLQQGPCRDIERLERRATRRRLPAAARSASACAPIRKPRLRR